MLAGGLLFLGCVDPYSRSPLVDSHQTRAAREILEGDQPPNSIIRSATDCQYTFLGAIPYWGLQPSADQPRSEIMRTAPPKYLSTVEGESSIQAWGYLGPIFQAYCVELTIRFDGVE